MSFSGQTQFFTDDDAILLIAFNLFIYDDENKYKNSGMLLVFDITVMYFLPYHITPRKPTGAIQNRTGLLRVNGCHESERYKNCHVPTDGRVNMQEFCKYYRAVLELCSVDTWN